MLEQIIKNCCVGSGFSGRFIHILLHLRKTISPKMSNSPSRRSPGLIRAGWRARPVIMETLSVNKAKALNKPDGFKKCVCVEIG